VIETVKLEVHLADPRWAHLRDITAAIEAVLQDRGSWLGWRPSDSDKNSSISKRQMMFESQCKHSNIDIGRYDEAVHQFHSEEAHCIYSEQLDVDTSSEASPVRRPHGSSEHSEPNEQQTTLQEKGESLTPRLALETSGPTDGMNRESILEDVVSPGSDVTNEPNLSKANPRGQQNGMMLDGTAEQRRMHYTRADSVLEGWVWKRSRHLKWWRRRWLVLTKLGVETMKTQGGFKPTESIERRNFGGVFCANGLTKMERCFCVVDQKGRRFYMACDEEAEKAEWLKQIDTVLTRRR
jgi:hypothetical protein